MNPEETRKRADLLHCYLADEESRIQNLRIVGVTKKLLGGLSGYYGIYRRAYAGAGKRPGLPFIGSSRPDTGIWEYLFDVVSLKGPYVWAVRSP